jgi:hypothetical protein
VLLGADVPVTEDSTLCSSSAVQPAHWSSVTGGEVDRIDHGPERRADRVREMWS